MISNNEFIATESFIEYCDEMYIAEEKFSEELASNLAPISAKKAKNAKTPEEMFSYIKVRTPLIRLTGPNVDQLISTFRKAKVKNSVVSTVTLDILEKIVLSYRVKKSDDKVFLIYKDFKLEK